MTRLALLLVLFGAAGCASTSPRVYTSGAGRADHFCVQFCAPALVSVDVAGNCQCEAVVSVGEAP